MPIKFPLSGALHIAIQCWFPLPGNGTAPKTEESCLGHGLEPLHTETRANTKVPPRLPPHPQENQNEEKMGQEARRYQETQAPYPSGLSRAAPGALHTVPPLTFKRWAQGREGFQEDPPHPTKAEGRSHSARNEQGPGQQAQQGREADGGQPLRGMVQRVGFAEQQALGCSVDWKNQNWGGWANLSLHKEGRNLGVTCGPGSKRKNMPSTWPH